jgi:peptide/nickel transport system permease protein/oligopeptide transport system permease protein
MGGYLIKRLLQVIPALLGVSLLVFFMIRLIPGDPALLMAGDHASPEMLAAIRRDLGLDRQLHHQYFIFMRNLLRGDLGRSTQNNKPVITEIWGRFRNTIELAVPSLFIAMLIGIPAGVIAATRPNSIWDGASMFVALSGMSIPAFWLGLMLMLLFSVTLGWFPVAGRGTILHLILPSVTLGLIYSARLARMTRSGMLEVLQQEYITTARSKGLREHIVIYKHALKNASIPVITIMGLQFGWLLGGAVLTETVFAWPGLGRLMVDSLLARDYPVFQGTLLLLAGIFILINLFVDILYCFLDPRIRYG